MNKYDKSMTTICWFSMHVHVFQEYSDLFIRQVPAQPAGEQRQASGVMSAGALLLLGCWQSPPSTSTPLSSSCLSATTLVSCSAGSASWTGAWSVSGGANHCRSVCAMSPRRCATKYAKIRLPPPLPRPGHLQEAPPLEKTWCPCLKIHISFPTARNRASTTSNQRKGHVSVPQGRSTVTAKACGSKWTR